MGAEQFVTYARGKTAEEAFQNARSEAFQNARSEAQYEYGHGGYTGTIAEKDNFKIVPLPAAVTDLSMADEAANAIMSGVATSLDPTGEIHDIADDKWGPAACFDLGNGGFLFFGWASS